MISIIVPSKGRPNELSRMISTARDTAYHEVEICVYLDEGDESYGDLGKGIKVIKGREKVLSKMWDQAYKISTGDIVLHAADDIVFKTKNWDKKVESIFSQFPDQIILVYGDDGILGSMLPTHSFLSRSWITASGYMCPPYFVSDGNDRWLSEVADLINRKYYLPNLFIEHMHFVVGKSKKDKTYKDRLVAAKEANIEKIYDEKISDRYQQADKLRSLISNSPSTKIKISMNITLRKFLYLPHKLRLYYLVLLAKIKTT